MQLSKYFILTIILLLRSGWAVAWLVDGDGDAGDDSDSSSSDSESNSDDEEDDEKARSNAIDLTRETNTTSLSSLVEPNPNYVGPTPDQSEGDKDSSKDIDKKKSKDQKENKSIESKMALQKALAKSKIVNSVRKRAGIFLRKHGIKITIAIGIFAFRKEIKTVLIRSIYRPVYNAETGELVGHTITLPSPTDVMKIVVFIDLMRRLQQFGRGNGSSSLDDDDESIKSLSPLVMMLLAGSRGNPALMMFLHKLLSPQNSAYLPPIEQHYTFETLNKRYTKDNLAFEKATKSTTPVISNKDKGKKTSSLARLLAEREHERNKYNQTAIVLDWTDLDSSVTNMAVMRDEVSFLLKTYAKASAAVSPSASNAATTISNTTDNNATGDHTSTSEMEVILLLESPGGSASDYALAAEQVLRMRRKGMKVTVCVDKVAASGGYMVACTASPGRLFAAPFAVVGSIGVVGQTVNIHKALKGYGVEPLVFRGGKDKAPVGLIGEVTREGLAKVQDLVDKTHFAFKRHVVHNRPILRPRIEDIATGDVWLAYDGLSVGLVDRLVSSDEYVEERMEEGALVLKLVQVRKPKYPFSRPTTTVSSIGSMPTETVSSTTSFVQDLLEKIVGMLRTRTTDDNQLLTFCTKAACVPDTGYMSKSG